MMMKIKELATVQMGYSFRSRLDLSERGDVAVIQMKDLLDDNTVDCGELIEIDIETVKETHFALKGDLIFRSRGRITTSAILLEDPGKAIVSAPLLRIRVMWPDKILPEYLNWYISQQDAQIYLVSRAKGSVQRMISKHTVENLEVVLPSLDVQRNIVELAVLSQREQILLYTLAEKREQYIGTVLMQIAKEGKNEGNN